jgi:hypothetical protein
LHLEPIQLIKLPLLLECYSILIPELLLDSLINHLVYELLVLWRHHTEVILENSIVEGFQFHESKVDLLRRVALGCLLKDLMILIEDVHCTHV